LGIILLYFFGVCTTSQNNPKKLDFFGLVKRLQAQRWSSLNQAKVIQIAKLSIKLKFFCSFTIDRYFISDW